MTKKETIINSAIKLFSTNGFEGTSVREIAADAEVNVAMINYYFVSKEKLFESVVEYKASVLKGIFAELFNNKELTAIEKLDAQVVALAVAWHHGMVGAGAQRVDPRPRPAARVEHHRVELGAAEVRRAAAHRRVAADLHTRQQATQAPDHRTRGPRHVARAASDPRRVEHQRPERTRQRLVVERAEHVARDPARARGQAVGLGVGGRVGQGLRALVEADGGDPEGRACRARNPPT